MTLATVTRANSYIATESTVALDKARLRRGNTYVAATPTDAGLDRAFVRRGNTYLVAMLPPPASGPGFVSYANAYVATIDPAVPLDRAFTRYANTYLVGLPDSTGDARQRDDATRPLYRGGAVPYVEHGASGALEVFVPGTLGGSWEWIAYLPDGTFDERTLTLAPGAVNALPAVDFNQAVLVRGTLARVARRSIKHSLGLRVVANVVGPRPSLGSGVLLSGDQQSGSADVILLSGDQQSGADVITLSGDQI